MKTSKQTKILALFLAVIMALTSIPFVALAATTDDYNTVISAINNYKDSMKNGYVYSSGMKNAYEKYLNAKKLADSYYYGDNKEINFGNAASDLNSAVNAMKNSGVYTAPNVTANDKPQFDIPNNDNNLSKDNEMAARYSNNLLWASKLFPAKNHEYFPLSYYATVDNTYWENATDICIQYGDVVMLYDGVNIPQFPIKAMACKWTVNGNGGWLYSIYPANQKDNGPEGAFRTYKPANSSMPDNKVPKEERYDMWCFGVQNNGYFNIMQDNAWNYISGDYNNRWRTGDRDNGDSLMGLNSKNTAYKTLGSTLRFEPNAEYLKEDGKTVYAKNYNLNWGAHGFAQCKRGNNDWPEGYTFGSKKVTYNTGMVNWVAIQNLAKKATGFNRLKNVAMFDSESDKMLKMFEAIDNVTAFNPNSPKSFAGATLDYSNVAATMKTINDDMQKADEAIEDSIAIDYYDPLYTAIDNAKAADTNNRTTSSLSAYNEVLDEARAWFADGNGSTHLYSNYSDLAQRLNQATAKLEYKADFSPLNGKPSFDIEDKAWTAESLENMASAYAQLDKTYLNTVDKDNVGESANEAIKTEASNIDAVLNTNTLTPATAYEGGAFETILAKYMGEIDNTDRYNRETLQTELDKVNADAYEEVEIVPGMPKVVGTNYIDDLTERLLTALNVAQYKYNVQLNDKKDYAVNVRYGETITLPESESGYMVTYIAKETGIATTPVFVGKITEIAVRGDMVIEDCKKASADECVVKYVDQFGNVIDSVVVTKGDNHIDLGCKYIVPAFYHLAGYSVDGKTLVSELNNVEEDTKVYIMIAPNEIEKDTYTVTVYDLDGTTVYNTFYKKYNGLVDVEVQGANAYYDENGTCVWNDGHYKFAACQDINLYAKAEGTTKQEVSVINPLVYTGDKTKLVGSFTNTDNYTVISQGFVLARLDKEENKKFETEDLTLADVKKGMVYNFSSAFADKESNQFVYSIFNYPFTKATYVAYVIYKDNTTGEEEIAYSTTQHNFELKQTVAQ